MFPCRWVSRCIWPIAIVLLASLSSSAKDVAPAALLSSKCVVAFEFDGFDPHRAAFEGTALAELLRGDLRRWPPTSDAV